MVPTRAPAMELKIVGNQLFLSGPVVGDEPGKVREALASSPGVETVILRNSGGGNAPAGYQVGQLLRERGMRTDDIGDIPAADERHPFLDAVHELSSRCLTPPFNAKPRLPPARINRKFATTISRIAQFPAGRW
jgi:hypothetical protein